MRLRDGFEFDKKFVNENIDKIRKLPEIERELTARVQQFRDAQAQHAQKEQFLAQALPLAIANAQAAIPQEPEPPVYDRPILSVSSNSRPNTRRPLSTGTAR